MNEKRELSLASSKSMQISLEAIRSGSAGLDSRRQALLARVPESGDWATLPLESVELKDLAYLTAKTGDEFALLRGKREDVLLHGARLHCRFNGALADMLWEHRLELVGHSHPGELSPIPSGDDKLVLRELGQRKSAVISAMTGIIKEFGPDPF